MRLRPDRDVGHRDDIAAAVVRRVGRGLVASGVAASAPVSSVEASSLDPLEAPLEPSTSTNTRVG
jgi:hypothetical protein